MSPRFAVLTSGGDAPGMNAAIRAIVRSGVAHGCTMLGVRHGYEGLVRGEFLALGPRDVGGIIQCGGTILGSSRCADMYSDAGQRRATDALTRNAIDGLIVIGGDGSQNGALALSRKGVPVVGVASTIDNDLACTEITIGTTSALDIALEAIDRLRTTAASHQRAFLLEVMGRHCGYLALIAGIAGGAEAIVIPEVETDPETLAAELSASRERGKSHAIVVVAEGAPLGANELAAYFREHRARLGFELRITKLGHVQRGGHPGVFDRMLATRLGVAAIERLVSGQHGVMIGWMGGAPVAHPLTEVTTRKRALDAGLLSLAKLLVQ